MVTITSDDILGKLAIDRGGDEIGIVTQLHIDKDSKSITGITIDQGFMKPDLFIGIKYIHNFGKDSVFLNKVPYEKIKGMNILDDKGDLIGYVEDVILKKHKIDTIVMKKSRLSSKKKLIVEKDIHNIKDEIILKKGFELNDE